MRKIILCSIAVSLCAITYAQKTTSKGSSDQVPVEFLGLSKPLRDAAEVPVTEAMLNGKRVEHDNPTIENKWLKHYTINPNALPKGPDPALQKKYTTAGESAAASLSILSNWAGIAAAVDPSDNTLAVSSNYVMQMTNNSTSTYIRIWNKSGTVLVNNKLVSSITGTSDYGDCDLVYDWVADRFVFVVLKGIFTNKLIVCVSQTNDPTGSWYTYSFKTSNGFPDYPKIGMWGNSYFVTTNSNTPTIFALDRANMLTGSAMRAAQVFKLTGLTVNFESSSPVSFTGATAAPANAPALVIRPADDGWNGVAVDHLELFSLLIDWPNPGQSTITGPVNLNTAAYASNVAGAPMPGTTRKLDELPDILMDKAQYINTPNGEFLVCSAVTNASGNGVAGVRWYILKKDNSGNWAINQQSTYSPDNSHRFMSSMSMNNAGTVALGYNISSSSVYPGINLTGRAYCDAPNTMTVAETVAKSGAAANSNTRYGDYNGLVVDPADGSFWLTANYNQTTKWSTNVTHFTITSCPGPSVADVMSSSPDNAVAQSGITKLSAAPLPANNEVKISFSSENAGSMILRVTDINGKEMMLQRINAVAGLNQQTINVSSLVNGTYLLQLQTLRGMVSQKIEVRH